MTSWLIKLWSNYRQDKQAVPAYAEQLKELLSALYLELAKAGPTSRPKVSQAIDNAVQFIRSHGVHKSSFGACSDFAVDEADVQVRAACDDMPHMWLTVSDREEFNQPARVQLCFFHI